MSIDWEVLGLSSETIKNFIGHITSIIESFLEGGMHSEYIGSNFTLGSLLNFGGGKGEIRGGFKSNDRTRSNGNGTDAAPSFFNLNSYLEGNRNSSAAETGNFFHI